MTRDFSPLFERVLAGVKLASLAVAAVCPSSAEMELKMKKLFYGFSFLFDDAGIRRFITILRTEPQLGFALLVLKFY